MYVFLIPSNEIVLVRDPRTKEPLPKIGMLKSLIGAEGRYWRRRIKNGTVKIINSPAVKAATQRKTKIREEE